MNSILLDTNILFYANNPLSPFQIHAQNALIKVFTHYSDIWLTRQIIREYVKVMSKEMLDGGKVDYTRLNNDVVNFEPQFNVGEDTHTITERLMSLIRDTKTAGKQAHDANIVVTILQYDVRCILTHNVSDFKRFEYLIEIVPMIA